MKAKDKIFREYDIRGVVGEDFDAGLAEYLGFALGQSIRGGQFGPAPSGRLQVAVGFDCRLSREEMSRALISGITASGCDVLNCGMGPTPQLYFMAVSQKKAGGVQITASHNPGDQNGFKMMVGPKTLSGPDIQELKRQVQEIDRSGGIKPSAERGTVTEIDARSLYLKDLVERSRSLMGKKKLKLVVDGGNGVGGLVGPALLRELGCEVIELYTEPDGRFPNHEADPTVLENIAELRKRVVAEKADAGIAWDGDADRIGVVDEKGNPIYGDMLLVIYGRQLVKAMENPIIIGDVKCSELLFTDLSAKGANTVMAKTGHSLIKAKLKELHAHLAGEMSGHMFFAHRFFGFDDALHASARFVEILSNADVPTSGLLAGIPKMYNTPEIRVDCPEEIKFQVAEKAKSIFPEYETNTIDGVRVKFEKGWGLVRASNTQPVLVMRFEAETEGLLNEYRGLVENRIKKLRAELS